MAESAYQILGCSNATVSMILETVRRIHGPGTHVYIIQNILVDDSLPYAVDGVDTTVVMHDEGDFPRNPNAVLGVYRPSVKEAVFDFFRSRYGVQLEHFARLVDPGAAIARTARLGNGVTVQPHAVIAPYAQIGNLVTINRLASVGHHTVLGDLCTLNPGVHVGGNCRVGDNVTIGIGANVVDGIRIGDGAFVGAGSMVKDDIPPGVMVFGTPAKILRRQ